MCHGSQVLRLLCESDSVGIPPEILGFSVDDRFSEAVVLAGRTFCRLEEKVVDRSGTPLISPLKDYVTHHFVKERMPVLYGM